MMLPFTRTSTSVLPGYRLSMGVTLAWLFIIVLLPLSVLMVSFAHIPLEAMLKTLANPRVQSAFLVSFSSATMAAIVATLLGLLIAWVLTRYHFYGAPLLDALIDIPFALPTAIAGIALSAIYAPDGWVGQWLQPLGIELVFNRAGIVLALIFLGIPFVVRSVEPVLAELDSELEEAAGSLGASKFQVFRYVILPHIAPALLSGFALAFARGLGEYGSVIFLAGNVPEVSEIVPLAIITALEGYDMQGAIVMAVVMLLLSFAVLYFFNWLQARLRRSMGERP
jgi:sulfate transport system permease protein